MHSAARGASRLVRCDRDFEDTRRRMVRDSMVEILATPEAYG